MPTSMKRAIKPRPTLVVQPAFVSQETSLQLLGVDPRRFLELVVPRCAGAVTKLGKLRLVPLEVAVERLRALASAALPDTTNVARDVTNDDDDDDQPTTAAEVLARLGMRIVPKAQ